METFIVTSRNILMGRGVKAAPSVSEYLYTFEVTKEALAKIISKGYKFNYVK